MRIHHSEMGTIRVLGLVGEPEVNKIAAAAREEYVLIERRVEESMNNGPFVKLEVKLTPVGDGEHEVRFLLKQ